MWRRLIPVLALVGTLGWLAHAQAANFGGYSWPQFNGNSQHSGFNSMETHITKANVSTLHLLFTAPLPDVADGAPAYQATVYAGGFRNLLFVTTRDGHILALDAHSGYTLWSRQNGPGTCTINNDGTNPCYTTSSPAVAPPYVYTYGLDGKVHRYSMSRGTEATGGGWPEGTTLKPWDEKGSSALSLIATSSGPRYLWVGNGGYPGDNGDYQGHVTVINLATGAQKVFNTLCSNQTVHFVETPGSPDCPEVQSAVWARPAAVYSSQLNRVFIATGNGTFSPANHDWGDSVLALNPDGSGVNGGPLDSYTPADYQNLQDYDLDLGSTAPAILPSVSTGGYPYLAVQGGKDGILRLLNLVRLSGRYGPGHTGGEVSTTPVPQGGEVLTQPAVWQNSADNSIWVFVANDNGISALKLKTSTTSPPTLQTVWTEPNGGTSPIVANGIVYYAGGSTIRALDALTGNQLWSDSSLGGIHWESPIVANGVVYITSEDGTLRAYGL